MARYTKFEEECLDEHNKLRAMHGVPPLALDRNLCGFAEEWAKVLLEKNTMEHRDGHNYGENIYMASGKDVEGSLPVQAWYKEIKDYDFQKAAFSPKTGHFTQIVWKSTKNLGVGRARSGKVTFVVCNYDPPGNFKGKFSENVLPATV